MSRCEAPLERLPRSVIRARALAGPRAFNDTEGMGQLKQIVVDCRQPATLAAFWAVVLDGFEVRAYDDAEIERLASIGRTPETDPCVLLDGPTLEFCFQEIVETSAGKRPLHVDIEVQDRAAEMSRLVSLGATVVQHFDHHTWMRDPEGNDFCITDP